ncbi:MAG TPA: DUF169 domain-containing protein [Terriglobales bacterium]|nr:DUF169 domain-containing protein [Terriglobales bacterium]
MVDFKKSEQQLTHSLGLKRRPVAVSFVDDAGDVPKFEGMQPSGCSYWRLAGEGGRFYTEQSDHQNCVIGAHTHNIQLPESKQKELGDKLGFMSEIGYIKMEEVAKIPQIPFHPKKIVYTPLSDAKSTPDVVIVVATPAKIMLASEAAMRAGIAAQLQALGRPTCATIPAAMAGGVTASTGCIGNRVYTEIAEHELYVAIPGGDLDNFCEALETIVSANAILSEYHQSRKAELTR